MRNKKRTYTLATFFNIVLEVLVMAIREEERKKTGKEGKLSLFADNMILHIENGTCSPAMNSVKFSPVAQSFLAFCDPMVCSTPGFPVLHHLPDPAQTHVH